MRDHRRRARRVSVTEAVDVLNEALQLEPQAISDLFRVRIPFASEALADHPTIQVGVVEQDVPELTQRLWSALGIQPDRFDIGAVGLLNGIFGTTSDGISISVDEDFYENPEKLITRFNAHINWGSMKADAK